jgi:signal transduction histidine kinase
LTPTVADRRRRRLVGTVRSRTTLLATVIVGAALVVGAGAFWVVLQESLIRDIDQVTELRAAGIAAYAASDKLPSVLPADDDEAVQVINASSVVVAASANVGGRGPVVTAMPSGEEPTVTTVDSLPGLTGQSRLLVLRAADHHGHPVTVAVATSLKHADNTLHVARQVLLIGVPILLLFVATTTRQMVGHALAPVEAIRTEVVRISDGDLGRRVPVTTSDDEVARLARTMNTMLDRLQDTSEKQASFIADASHELRSPIAAIRAELEVAVAHPGDVDWPVTARTVLAENRQMERLVADLLYMARLNSDPHGRPKRPLDLHEIVADEVSRARAGAGRLTISTGRIDGVVIDGHREDLARALRNLLDNAQRHATTSVLIELQVDGDDAIITIDDDGGGVPAGDRIRIFERFVQVEAARGRESSSTGLGLAIVDGIIADHKGSVLVTDNPSGGARFVVRLPVD